MGNRYRAVYIRSPCAAASWSVAFDVLSSDEGVVPLFHQVADAQPLDGADVVRWHRRIEHARFFLKATAFQERQHHPVCAATFIFREPSDHEIPEGLCCTWHCVELLCRWL